MPWPFRRRDPAAASRPPRAREPHAHPAPDDTVDVGLFLAFTCSTCGRTDLPEAGDWDPPICEECDAAINFDALSDEMSEGLDDLF